MTARLSRREAERLGLTPARAPRDPYHTRCVDCGEVFTRITAETRHMEETGHRCYALVEAEPEWRPRAAVIDPLIDREWARRITEAIAAYQARGRWL